MPATLTATLIGQPPRPARSRTAAAIIRMLWAPTVFGWIVLLPPAALADRTTVQDVPCEPGPERRLAVDGSVSACRLAAAADLLVDPAGGNGKVPCAAGSAVEFHRNGYLSFCEAAGAAASYRDRAEVSCLAKARLAFGEGGYLEYCS